MDDPGPAAAGAPALGLLLLSALAPPAALAAAPPTAAAPPAASPPALAAAAMEVRPSDWAYRALNALADRHSCPTGQLQPLLTAELPISRFEAAALLQACLRVLAPVQADGAAATTQAGPAQREQGQLQGLRHEFRRELGLLGQRSLALEARRSGVAEREFSTTTSLAGSATFVLGGNAFLGRATGLVTASRQAFGGTTLTDDLELSLDTSFNGRDLLRTVLRQGNMTASPFGGAGPSGGLALLDVAYVPLCGQGPDCRIGFGIDRLFYQLPLGGGFTATLGARVEQDDMFARLPSVYPSDPVLNLFAEAGNPAAFNMAIGPGAGLWWKSGRWSIATSYVASWGWLSNASQGGLASAGSAGVASLQLGYGSEDWGLTALYSRIQGGFLLSGATPFTALAIATASHTHAFSLSGTWQPLRTGWLPSLSAGWGLNLSRAAAAVEGAVLTTSQAWMLGLQWKDALAPGNSLGLAIGQPVFATALASGGAAEDGSPAAEGWYSIRISDAIHISPALFLLSRPLGRLTPAGSSYRQVGALLKTSFSF